MRSKSELNFGLGTLHLDVLRARLRRRRKTLRIMTLVGICLIVLWVVRPLLLGRGTLELVDLLPDTMLSLDGRPLRERVTQPVSGQHQLEIMRPGHYPLAMEISITRAQTTTLTLPALRPRPAVQPIPLPAPGASWQVAVPDSLGGWRLAATTADVQPTPGVGSRLSTELLTPARTLLHLDTLGVTRLSALEAYTAADEQITPAGRFWAVWEPLRADFHSERGQLTITTPATTTVITTTTTVTGLWWAPGGGHLLVAEQHGIGQDVLLWSAPPLTPTLSTAVVTIPGRVASVHWSTNGRAAVVLSTTQQWSSALSAPNAAEAASPPWDATLIILPPHGDAARTLRLAPPPPAPLGLVPMAWSTNALLWTADTGDGLVLERIRFGDGLPVRVGRLPAGTIAVRVLDNEQVRLLLWDGTPALRVQAWPARAVLFTLDEVPAAPRMGGIWRDDGLLLAAGERDLWYLSFAPEALR